MATTTNENTSGGVAGTIDGTLNKATGWVDKLFEFFGLYTSKYSKYIIYAVLLFFLGKMLKIRLNLDTSRGRK